MSRISEYRLLRATGAPIKVTGTTLGILQARERQTRGFPKGRVMLLRHYTWAVPARRGWRVHGAGRVGVTGQLTGRRVQSTSTQLRCGAAVQTPHGKAESTCGNREGARHRLVRVRLRSRDKLPTLWAV